MNFGYPLRAVRTASLFLVASVVSIPYAPAQTIAGKKATKSPARITTADLQRKAQVAQAFGNLPLAFEPNQGQTAAQVKFLARRAGATLFLTRDEAVLALQRDSRQLKTEERNSETGKSQFAIRPRHPSSSNAAGTSASGNDKQTAPAVLRMKVLGANRSATAAGVDELPGKSNYFIGNDARKWHTDVPNYAKVRYRNIYPGVDLVYYGKQGQLEYDFVVAPGADPRSISLELSEGLASPKQARQAAAARIAANGDLVIGLSGGEVRLHKPTVYQPANGVQASAASGSAGARLVNASYVLKGNEVGFEVANYDRSKPLVIDRCLPTPA